LINEISLNFWDMIFFAKFINYETDRL